jgi:tetratricopeptide (TPR) repeat protein
MRRYQSLILIIGVLAVVYLLFMIATITVEAAQDTPPREPPLGTAIPVVDPPPGVPSGDLATQVYSNAQISANAAQDAQRYAQDASDEVSKHMDTVNNLLGLFQNVTAIVGVLLPVLAIAGGFLGFNSLNEAQKKLEDARDRFEKEMLEKQAELQKVREDLERTVETQREGIARSNLALSLLTLGERQYRSQDFAGALDTYRRALELDPSSLITHYRLGYVYTQSGNLEQAQHHLTRALEIENNFAPALAALGYVYRRIGEKMPQGIEREKTLNKAESLLLEGLAISPKLVDDDDESWWGSLGGLYRRRNQVDEAISAYEKAGEITPKSSYAFSNLALLYVQKNDKEAMLRAYQRVEQLAWGEVQADVDNYWAYADLLTARLALGKEKEAEEVLSSVLEIAPADSPYVFESLLDTLKRLQSALGEKDSAHMKSFIDRIQARVNAKNGDSKA